MATLVCFHAHPDDAEIMTAGAMMIASEAGHRVVLVIATKGELGLSPAGLLYPGESLAERRVRETEVAARTIGVDRVEFLGYHDSGMAGDPENEDPQSFWQADVEDAAQRLAAILVEENADALTIYDEHGTYGHPDHIKVHHVGARAGAIAGTPRVYEYTMDQDELDLARASAVDGAIKPPDEIKGTPAALITTIVDASAYARRKFDALFLHESQLSENENFSQMGPEVFAMVFGTERYRLHGAPEGFKEDTILG